MDLGACTEQLDGRTEACMGIEGRRELLAASHHPFQLELIVPYVTLM